MRASLIWHAFKDRMALSRTQIPKPENHQDFERQCAVLWSAKLKDPNLQRLGRSGQNQHGLDIIGIRDDDPRKRVGIQCKLKNGNGKLTEKEVRREFEAALAIKPPLTEFHIVTTADRDAEIQLFADQLAVEQMDAGRKIRFIIWGWQAITDELGQYPDALLAFDDSYGVFGQQTMAAVNKGIDLQQAGQEKLLAAISEIQSAIKTQSPADTTVEVALAIEKHLDAEIDGYRDANKGGQRRIALGQFTALLERVQRDGVSGRILFRIKANIGSCHLLLGNEEEGIKWLLEAFDHAPLEPKAIANKAYAHLLMEDWDTVLAMGRENLKSETADEMLSSYVIQAARFSGFTGDPLTLVPTKDREAAGVLLAMALFQRSKPGEDWKTLSRTLAERFPEERLARQLAAEADLDDVVGDNNYVDHVSLTESDLEKLKRSSITLAELWDEVKAEDNRLDESQIAICGNLILSYRVLGDHVSAMVIVREMLAIPDLDDGSTLRAAAAAMEAGDHPAVEEILPRLPASPSRNLLVLQMAVLKGDWDTLAKLDPDNEEAYPPTEWILCRTAIRLGQLWRIPDEERIPQLAKLIQDVEKHPRASIITAQYCANRRQPGLAEKAWVNARSNIDDRSHIASRMMVAIYAYRNRYWSDTASLLIGHIAVDRDSEELKALAGSLVQERPIKQRAVEFFTGLPAEVRSSAHYRYLEGLMEFNRGNLASAELIFSADMDASPRLELLLMMIMILRRQNRSTEIPPLLAHFDIEALDGTPIEKMRMAEELRRAGHERAAIEMAYPVLRANLNDEAVNLSYAILVFSMEHFGDIVRADTAEVGTWVQLSGSNGKDFDFVIEEGANDPSGGYLSPTHKLAAETMGKAAGDTISIPQQIGDQITWRIKEIKHRFLHAFHDVLANFQTKFPTSKGLFAFTMNDGDLSPVLDVVRRFAERGEKAIDLYVKSRIPFQLVAGMFNENPINIAGGIVEADEDVSTCLGIDPEREAAYALIRNSNRRGVVLDAHAAWTAATLDVLDIIEASLGPIYLPQSALDNLITFRGFDDIKRSSSLTLFHRGGETFRREHTQESVEAREHYISLQIAKIEKACVVAPVAAPNDITPLESMILEKCGERVLDPIYLCTDGRVLLSEDLRYRQFAKEMRVEGLWLQVILMEARGRGAISAQRYADAVVNLAILRHGPVAIDAPLIRSVIDRDPSGDLRTLDALARYIGSRGADYISHTAVVQEFIDATANDRSLDRLVRQRSISILLRKLIRHTGDKWPLLIEMLEEQAGFADREYLTGWLKGHFLNPAIIYALRRRVSAIVVQKALAASRLGADTSPQQALLETRGASAPALLPPRSPRSSGRPDLPPRKRRSKRRR
ncbi:TPR repeat-containing protein [Rhizobium freirei PRF 81]|uniref:TPR repeat-containing protein n=1 Tax=Rhizobium freirei PRF 81 TaxID=363754 RepID=N6VEN5_9HYPH|nr:restriction endonuclease [Rhizobium freirei]ENN89537.1 TPR repeat-containing protein [Rhizobium freirei PRF 81]